MQQLVLAHAVAVLIQTAAAIWFLVFVLESHRRATWIVGAVALLGASLSHAVSFTLSTVHGEAIAFDYSRDVLYPVTFGILLVSIVRLRPVFNELRRAEMRAREEAEFRQQTLDVVESVLIALDCDGKVTLVNRRGCELLGVAEEQVVGADWFGTFVPEEIAADKRESCRRFFVTSGVEDARDEFEVQRPDGECRRVAWHRSIVRDEHGVPVSVLSAGEDVTERRMVERALEFEAYLLDSAIDGILVCDFEGHVLYVNEAGHRLRGYSREEFTALPPFSWVAPESEDRLPDIVETLRIQGEHFFEIVNRTKSGDRIPVEVHARVVEYEGQPVIAAVTRDISERKHAEETIARLAYHDSLTGLPNRRYLLDRLDAAMESARLLGGGLAVMMLDLDYFKAVNDSLGHDAGDRLLVGVAERLRRVLDADDVTARMGGDEFALILPGVNNETNALSAIARIQSVLTEPFDLDGHMTHMSFSIGVALLGESDHAEQLVRNADLAMNQAKRQGRNVHEFFRPQMDSDALTRFALKNALRVAVEGEQLELRYQPIVAADGSQVVGVEALLRWRHPERGLIPPNVFIPLAEESGAIIPMGEWVLRTACRHVAEWRRSGIPALRLAVNLSLKQLLHPDLVDRVIDALATSGLEPELLELEITESAAMRDADSVIGVLQRLRAIGVRLAIDDFGTGHSSLDRLRMLPIDTLKIDKSFIDEVCTNAESKAITNAVFVLASSLGLEVVAEGVETGGQAEYLRKSGCDALQGYYFAKAASSEETVRLLREWPRRGLSSVAG